MLNSGTDPEAYIIEHTLEYEDYTQGLRYKFVNIGRKRAQIDRDRARFRQQPVLGCSRARHNRGHNARALGGVTKRQGALQGSNFQRSNL